MSGRTRPERDLRVEVEKLLLEHEATSTAFISDLRGERVEAAPPNRVSDTLSPDDVLGHFLIIMELGAGGMGTVYKARDTRLDRPVALKVLFDAVVKPQTRRSLEREAKAISRLNHPHICTLYDIGQDVGIDYLVMEFLAGETIREQLKRGPYGLEDVIHFGVQIADALAEAHRCGLLHGDLKPSNVMITANGAKVLDFGLARPVDPARAGDVSWLTPASSAPQVLGTLPYMAPEQFEGSSDARSDIFSFGALLYEMASGTRAFGGASAIGVIHAVLHGDPAPVQMMRGRSAALGHIIDKCLPKNPENRWQSFEEIGEALKAARAPTSRHQVSRGGRPQAVIRSVRRLVVLPFDNLTPDTLEEYLLDGLTDALTGVLSGISQLRVISRASSQQLKTRGIDLEQLAKQFNIDGAIRGTVSGDADRVHVRVEVVRAVTGASLWERTYDCPLEDILQAQNEMAATIAIALQLSLTPADRKRLSADRRHRDREANEAYLRGLYHAGRGTLEGVRRSLPYLLLAVQKDPTYGRAHAAMAHWYVDAALFRLIGRSEALVKAKAAAMNAIELDSSLAEAHTCLGKIAQLEWDLERARVEFMQALQLNPNWTSALRLLAKCSCFLGRHEEALRQIDLLQQLDPVSPLTYVAAATIHYVAGRYEQAIRASEEALELEKDSDAANYVRGMALHFMGRSDETIDLLGRTRRDLPSILSGLAFVLARAGRLEDARRVIDEMKDRATKQAEISPYDFAEAYVGLGDDEQALAYLNRSCELRVPELVGIAVDPLFRSLRQHPQFRRILHTVGLDGAESSKADA